MRTVLVVDTHPDLWDMIRDAFEGTSDTTVLCTESGQDAARMIRDLPLALVIASVNVLEMSGYEVAKIAAEFDVPVLMMSGDLLAQDTLGQAGYLHVRKPFRLHELLRPWPETLGSRLLKQRRARPRMLVDSERDMSVFDW